MTEKERKRLRRVDLLELLTRQSREMDRLRSELLETREKLEQKELTMQESGSIAEAALKLSGIFEAAQASADQYLESVKSKYRACEEACAQLEQETRLRCRQMTQQAEERTQRAQEKLDEIMHQITGFQAQFSADNGEEP